jgi:hypothetical protein
MLNNCFKICTFSMWCPGKLATGVKSFDLAQKKGISDVHGLFSMRRRQIAAHLPREYLSLAALIFSTA